MIGGISVGVPLTLLQWSLHAPTHVPVDAPTIINNFALGSAIYATDRFDDMSPAQNIAFARVCAVLSTAFYASNLHTVALVPFVPLLHLRYADMKPYIGPVKPFFVAFYWVLAVYFVPIWRFDQEPFDLLKCTAFFLSIAALSHAADLKDIEEDEEVGVQTPAVLMRDDGAFAMALASGSVLLDRFSVYTDVVYDMLLLLVVSFFYLEWRGLALSTSLFIAFAKTSDSPKLSTMLLSSTEGCHSFAIHASTTLLETVRMWDDPLNTIASDLIFSLMMMGDFIGHVLLLLFANAVRLDF